MVFHSYSNNKYNLPFEIDKILSVHFPILGQGTQSLVCDYGMFVLKRTIDDDRSWDLDYNIRYRDRGLFSSLYSFRPNEYLTKNLDIYLNAQEKLIPIDNIMLFKEQIRKLYFPKIDINNFSDKGDWVTWEWGIDLNGIPKVMDWG